jgi:hypothetical protein
MVLREVGAKTLSKATVKRLGQEYLLPEWLAHMTVGKIHHMYLVHIHL